ncbi:MAG: hypothetical protein ABIP03_00575 [Aquihabitans sp.]
MTAQTQEYVDLGREVSDALRSLGLDFREIDGALTVDGNRHVLNLVARAHPTPADLWQVVEATAGRLPALVVADRLSEPGREVLRNAGWGWLDRRGHLRVWAPGLRLESPFGDGSSARRASAISRASNPWTTVGLEIAVASLIAPADQVTARRIAPRIHRSVGAVHELIARFTEVGLVGPTTRLPLLPELFWETASHWPDNGWLLLPIAIDELAAKVGPTSLLRVDERAATLGGALIPAAGDLPARCYVASAGLLRRARGLVDRDQPTQTWVRRAPVTWLPENLDHPPDDLHPWRVAHPVVCALRLAVDPSRGREIVETWGIVPVAEPDPSEGKP